VRAKQPDRLGLHYAHPEARDLRLARSTVALGVGMPDQLKRPKNRAIRSRFTTIDSSQVPWKIKARVKIQLHVKTRTRSRLNLKAPSSIARRWYRLGKARSSTSDPCALEANQHHDRVAHGWLGCTGRGFLVQPDIIPALGGPVWDTTTILSEKSLVGKVLHSPGGL